MPSPGNHGTTPRIIVLGGGYGGLRTAGELAAAGLGATLTLIDAKPEFEQRIRYHENLVGRDPMRIDYAQLLRPADAAFVHAQATGLDPARQTVTVKLAHGGKETLPYDILVYALGSRTIVTSVPGVAEFAHTLDSAASARKANEALTDACTKRVLIVGGGATGIETACEIAETWPQLSVTLATGQTLAADQRPGGLSPAAVEHLRATLSRLGVRVAANGRVVRVEKSAAFTADDARYDFDLCFWMCGFAPNDLARRSGIGVSAGGQIETDEFLRARSHPTILAVGDAAEVVTPEGGRCRMSCATARPMGAAAASTVAALVRGRAPKPFGFGYAFRCMSLGRHDGLIQFVDARDVARPVVWTGARAARWKEYICTRTVVVSGNFHGEAPDTVPEFEDVAA